MKNLPKDAVPVLQVFKTTEYESFKILKGNRRINHLHIKRLRQSIEEEYLISPIIVNQKMQIIDGQHRFFCCQHLKLPVYFIMVQGYDLPQVHRLNANHSNYKKESYLEGYCDLGYTDYIKMKEFMEKYPEFGINVSIMLLTNNTQGANQKNMEGGKKKIFENGKFKINDLKLAYINAEKILQFKPFYEGYRRQSFVAAMLGIFKNKNYVHEEMISKLSKNQSQLVDCTSIVNYRLLLEDIYNFRRREKINLRY